jgi:hypothetical protein
VLVTCNEVDHARREFPGVALVVVHGITLHSDEDRVPVADGGMMIVHEPWDVSICELTPLAFECALPRAPVSLPADIIDGAGPAGPCQMHVVPVVRQSETSDS